MCDLILLNGITTSSWYAELAFRRRVSMSAMGSVMVMTASGPFSPRFPEMRSVPGPPLPEEGRHHRRLRDGTYSV
ncbi:hypothetical protein GCM10023205_05640 [Yinghuangia aomiensis]|uniref:Uncharacterized protein n=1 Tax=Yinghuangia aomiensis TaxID=676205 RepID=A0ABP9GN70_9ACTN